MFSSASTIQAYFVTRFPILRWVSPLLFTGILQGIAAGIGTSNFLCAAFVVILKFSSFGSMKNIPVSCLAFVEFWFLDRPSLFCFLFRCNRHMLPHIWPYIIRTRGCLFPRQSPSWTMFILPLAFPSVQRILRSLPMHLIILFLHPRSSNLQSVLQQYVE